MSGAAVAVLLVAMLALVRGVGDDDPTAPLSAGDGADTLASAGEAGVDGADSDDGEAPPTEPTTTTEAPPPPAAERDALQLAALLDGEMEGFTVVVEQAGVVGTLTLDDVVAFSEDAGPVTMTRERGRLERAGLREGFGKLWVSEQQFILEVALEFNSDEQAATYVLSVGSSVQRDDRVVPFSLSEHPGIGLSYPLEVDGEAAHAAEYRIVAGNTVGLFTVVQFDTAPDPESVRNLAVPYVQRVAASQPA